MNESDEHKRVIELLRRARRPQEEITPEHLEENLRWLVRATRPEAQASDALRERVRSIAAAHQRRRASPLARLMSSAVPGRRRALAGAIPLAAGCLILFLLLTARAPAEMLARTLQAMAQVRSAHCTGWRIVYRSLGEGGPPAPEQKRVVWWYRAPNWYRKETQPEPPGAGRSLGQLIVKEGQNVLVSRLGATAKIETTLPPPLLARYLSPLDFFSQQGFLHRAEAQKDAQVTNREVTYRDRPIQIVRVEAPESQADGKYRERWILHVDPASGLVLRSESRLQREEQDGRWQTLEDEVLDRLDYNVPVKDSLFHIELPPHPDRPGSPRPSGSQPTPPLTPGSVRLPSTAGAF